MTGNRCTPVQIIAEFGRTGPDGRKFLLGLSTGILGVTGFRYSDIDRHIAKGYIQAVQSGNIEETVLSGHISRYTLKERI